jgi:hypothetical protein
VGEAWVSIFPSYPPCGLDKSYPPPLELFSLFERDIGGFEEEDTKGSVEEAKW